MFTYDNPIKFNIQFPKSSEIPLTRLPCQLVGQIANPPNRTITCYKPSLTQQSFQSPPACQIRPKLCQNRSDLELRKNLHRMSSDGCRGNGPFPAAILGQPENTTLNSYTEIMWCKLFWLDISDVPILILEIVPKRMM